MAEVRTEMTFIQKGQTLEQIKRELQEISKIAKTQVRFGLFDKSSIDNFKKEIDNTVSALNNSMGGKGKSQILRDIKAWENELRLGNISIKEMSFLYKDAISKLENMKNVHKEISGLRVKDNELLNRSADIMKNITAQSTILKNQFKSGLIDNKQFSTGMNSLIDKLQGSGIKKADVLTSSMQKDLILELESRAKKEIAIVTRSEKEKTRIIEQENKKRILLDKKSQEQRIKLQQSIDAIISGYNIALMGNMYTLMNITRGLLPLEKQMYDLGVIANVSSGEINKLRTQVLELASATPFASQEVAKAINEIARTGKSVEESFIIVKEASKLAVASGKKFARKILLCWKPLRVA